jgi:hydroxyacylglutathione hydrolase
MFIKTLTVTPFAQNCRLVAASPSEDCAVVDPGGEARRIFNEINAAKLKVTSILLTHCHIDHAGGVAELLELLRAAGQNPKLYGHRNESYFRSAILRQAAMFAVDQREFRECPEPDEFIEEGSRVQLGSLTLQVLFTPGHSEGHVSFFFEKDKKPYLLAGDTIFNGSIGRTDLPGGDYETLMKSIREKLLVLPEDTIVMSGHGPDTTIGVETRNNPYVMEMQRSNY